MALSEDEEFELLSLEREKSRVPASRPLPANAGIGSLATGLLGLPVDAVEGAVNLGVAGYGTIKGLVTGDGGASPEPIRNSVGGSEWLKNKLRSTGMPGLSPDNPNPQDKQGTAQYNFVSRGGVLPGGALPALGSMAAEAIGGEQWAPVGALLPSAAGQVVRTGANAIPRNNTPQTQLLQKEGVPLTPGQQIGGSVKRMEDAATSVPVLGDAIKASQRRGVEAFDAAAMNRALEPIGEKLPKGMIGNRAVEYVYGKLGDAYDNLLPNLKGDLNAKTNGSSLKEDLDSIRQMGQNLPQPQRGQVGRIIEKEIVGRFTPQGLASGESIKEIESQLGKLAKGFGRSDNYDTRTLAGAVEEMRNSLRRMVERVNPDYQGELAKINSGYSNFKRVQNAAASVGAQDGVFTPAQLHRAVRSGDISKDKARFSEGNALLQDLSSAGRAVLPSSVPDSGTAMRAAMMYALANPVKASLLGIPIGAASLAYTPTGQAALKGVLSMDQAKPPRGLLQSILSDE